MLQVPTNVNTYLPHSPEVCNPNDYHYGSLRCHFLSSRCVDASSAVLETMQLPSLTVLQISDEQVAAACAEFQGLSDIVLCSLPDALLQPLLGRLHLEGSRFMSQQQQPVSAKQWLWGADPALRSVVAKEALQWHRGTLCQVNRRKDILPWDVMPSSRCFLKSGRNGQ